MSISRGTRRAFVAALPATFALAGCALHGAATRDPEWISPPAIDVRRLTLVVATEPPVPLKNLLEVVAAQVDRKDIAAFLRGHAEGGFGSGFVVVRDSASGPEAFVVTNRHVIDLADDAKLILEGGDEFPNATILYTDPRYDLAVLTFPEPSKVPFVYGFPLESSPVKDRQPVVATGFPGLEGEPSYQTTKGYVSNERLEVREDGEPLRYIQHTAPIDPGSSGGPLTNDAGAVVGINTLKVVGRDNVYVAIPEPAIADALRAAAIVKAKSADPSWRRERLLAECRALVGELASGRPKPGVLERAMSNVLIGERGFESLVVQRDDPQVREAFSSDPLDGLRWAVVRRLWQEVNQGGGVGPGEPCDAPNAGDWATIEKGGDVRIPMRLGRGPREVKWRFEQGHWKVASFAFRDPAAPTPRAQPRTPSTSGRGKRR